MGIYEVLAIARSRRTEDFGDAEVSDFAAEEHYGVGVRNLDEIKSDVENSCMLCFKKFGLLDNKIIPPAKMQDRDYFVRKGIVSSRYMCVECFDRDNRHKSPGRTRVMRFRRRINAHRIQIARV